MTSVQALGYFALHGVSSVSLTLLNKFLSSGTLSSTVVLNLQNVGSVVLSMLCLRMMASQRFVPDLYVCLRILPLSLLYVLSIGSSMGGLARLSVSSVTIGRSTAPLLTGTVPVLCSESFAYAMLAIGESLLFSSVLSASACGALLLIVVGSVLYSAALRGSGADTATGLALLGCNVMLSISNPLLEKYYVSRLCRDLPTQAFPFYRNLAAVPLLLGMLALPQSYSRGSSSGAHAPMMEVIALLVSIAFCQTIGFATFALQRAVSATTMVSANNGYKLCALVLSLILWEPSLAIVGYLGVLLNFVGLFWLGLGQSTHPRLTTAATHKRVAVESL
jgi:hypothetical protein